MSELPGPIEPTTTPTIGGLYAETFTPAGTPRGVVVITHGYAEHCGRYREVAHVIVNAGWAALSYDVRGHGKSPGERGYIDRFDTYLTDFAAVQTAARALAPEGAPMILLGHSHGSLITLRALASMSPPANIKAAVVSSPFLGLKLVVPGYKKVLARVASRVAPKLAQPNSLRVEDLTSDKQKQSERLADKLCFEIATSRWFTEASAAQDYVYEHASRITVPTTWLVGGADPIADPARSRSVADKVPGATYHDLVGLKHEVFNEVERGKVFAKLSHVLASV
ncbi:MAG TPA: lysophospholipase [Kofleriaceae bacterium]|jgi:alpha-beta hydrolase superfamily lysophospholipase|nr:lysophospholipase [Kofleriaceae bacterium]